MKKYDQRKVVLVGCGMVGMSYAYSVLNQNICDELVLIDVNKKRARGEANDLAQGLPFAPSSMKISSGEYSDCSDADLVVICAGAAQHPGESRRDLLQKNYKVFKSIVNPVVESGFNGVFLVASNPVDVMTQIVYELSGFPAGRVVGSGTSLDSARLRHMMSDYFNLNPRNVHAYVIGEHGDSEFVPWSQSSVSVMPLNEMRRITRTLMKIWLQSRKKFATAHMKSSMIKAQPIMQSVWSLQGLHALFCLMKTAFSPFLHSLRANTAKRVSISVFRALSTETACVRLLKSR